MATQPAAQTYADLERLREQGDDHLRYELIDGELFVSPWPSIRHQWVVSRLSVRLFGLARANERQVVLLSPLDVIINDQTIVQPDIMFLAADCAARLVERGIKGVPTLLAEVLSPSTADYDRGPKLALYERAGVPHCWYIDPAAQALEAYALRGGHYALVAALQGDAVFHPALFPGLVIRLGDLWPPPGAIADE